MKFSLVVITITASVVSGFQPMALSSPHKQRLAPLPVGGMTMGAVDIQETAQRDVYSMQGWAQQYGVQIAEGFEITTQDGFDWNVVANAYIPAGTPVLFVPEQLVMSSSKVEQEYGGNLASAEATLAQFEGTAQRTPLFRLMIKILAEYEKGADSPYVPWMNAMPRLFYNGVSMTDACFECLPPYAALLAMNERNTYSRFVNALRQGYLPLSPETTQNDALCKWAYNVALTRHKEVWEPVRQKHIAPMADMFNHASDPNVVITFDASGNCYATTMFDVQAGTPLTISLGDTTNPTPLFAKYGFLYNDCPTIFCKAIHLQDAIDDLGYDFKDLTFYTQTGDIAPKVYDIFLYSLLQNDPQNLGGFLVACKANDEASKQQYHGQYFQYTLAAMKEHVEGIVRDVDQLSMKAQSYDINTHPRVPVILAHNNLVRDTFQKVSAQLNAMG